ncbi:unnamed protein product, partial [Owenia fusiformis]
SNIGFIMANSTFYDAEFYRSLRIKGFGQIIISPFGFFINLLCVIVLVKHKRFHIIPNLFVFLMCLNDFIIYIVLLPVEALHILLGGGVIVFCAPWNYTILLLTGTNLMIYACIAINRYFLIVWNKLYRKVFTNIGCVVMILISFLVPGITLLQPILGFGPLYDFHDPLGWECGFVILDGTYSGFWELSLILSFAIPLLIMMFCYISIYWVLRKQRRVIENHQASDYIDRSKRVDVHFTKVMAMLFVIYCATYGPYMIVSNIGLRHVHYLYQGTLFLTKWNGLLNSTVYILMNRQVKVAILALFGQKPADNLERSNERRSPGVQTKMENMSSYTGQQT